MDIFEAAMEDLSENLVKGKREMKPSIQFLLQNHLITESRKISITNRLIEIIKYYHEYNDFIASTQNFLNVILFFAISTNAIGVAMCVVIALKLSISIGLAGFVILLFQIAVPCILGTIIAVQNERLSDILWSFPFYELDIAEQKIFLQFLQFAQTSKKIKVPIFGDVNMELFKNVLNCGYSYFMFIWNFI